VPRQLQPKCYTPFSCERKCSDTRRQSTIRGDNTACTRIKNEHIRTRQPSNRGGGTSSPTGQTVFMCIIFPRTSSIVHPAISDDDQSCSLGGRSCKALLEREMNSYAASLSSTQHRHHHRPLSSPWRAEALGCTCTQALHPRTPNVCNSKQTTAMT
jgi:hypothetical protein